MRKGKLTREQAIEQVGLSTVERVENQNCEPTGRVGYNGAVQGDSETEWSASVRTSDGILIVYYYTSLEDDECMAAQDGDGSAIDWEIAGYEIL